MMLTFGYFLFTFLRIYYGYGIKEKASSHSIDLKRQIIAEKDKGQNSTELGKKFKLQPSTVRSILGDRAAILRAIDRSGEAKRTRLYPVKHDDLEEAILRWFKAARSENVEMSGPLLQEKARKLAKELANQLRKGLGPRPLNEEQAKLDLEASMLELCDKMDDLMAKERMKNLKQNNITDYFVVNP
uniref:HTH CENPB-type domain-containing protein n=1 Tax=Ditylenchus dipsaci TaxID=166011 RepID=A0A915D165_9BILA